MRYKLNLALSMLMAAAVNLGCAQMAEKKPEAPEPAPRAMTAPPQAAIPADVLTRYTVVEGDNFTTISQQDAVYGNAYLWPLIFKANTDKLSDPDKLKPGMVLVVPRNITQADKDAASRYAKKRLALPRDRIQDLDLEYLQSP